MRRNCINFRFANIGMTRNALAIQKKGKSEIFAWLATVKTSFNKFFHDGERLN